MTGTPAASHPLQIWFLDTLVTVRVSCEDGSDGISLLENLAPRGDSPPLHVHHREDEVFHLIEGRLRFKLGDEELRLGAGESALVPKGVPHTYVVESERARWLVVTTRGDFERFVRALGRPAQRPDLPKPSPLPDRRQVEALGKAARSHGLELLGPPLD